MNRQSLLALLLISTLGVVTCDVHAHFKKNNHHGARNTESGSCTPGGGTSGGDTSGGGTSGGDTSGGDTSGGGTSGGGTSGGGTSGGGTINTVQTIIDDMTLPGDGFPHNNPYATYSSGIVEAGNNGSGYKSLTGWGEVYRDATDADDSNTRVELRNYQVFVLSKSTGQWNMLSSTTKVSGQYYHENWSPGTLPADTVSGAGGGVAVKLIHGYLFHFWADTSTKSNVVPINADDIAGIFTTVEARMVVDNQNLPDDRDSARYVVQVGGDYYSDATYTGTGHHLEIGGGRYKKVTNDWRAFNFITVDPANIWDNPPPVQ